MSVGYSGALPCCAAELERRSDPAVGQVHHHARGRVLEVVAVVHPQPGVVGDERDPPRLAGAHVDGVEPQCALDGDAVAGQHQHVMPVQVHRVRLGAAVDDRDHARRRPRRRRSAGWWGTPRR